MHHLSAGWSTLFHTHLVLYCDFIILPSRGQVSVFMSNLWLSPAVPLSFTPWYLDWVRVNIFPLYFGPRLLQAHSSSVFSASSRPCFPPSFLQAKTNIAQFTSLGSFSVAEEVLVRMCSESQKHKAYMQMGIPQFPPTTH